jgi:hypothetical protein
MLILGRNPPSPSWAGVRACLIPSVSSPFRYQGRRDRGFLVLFQFDLGLPRFVAVKAQHHFVFPRRQRHGLRSNSPFHAINPEGGAGWSALRLQPGRVLPHTDLLPDADLFPHTALRPRANLFPRRDLRRAGTFLHRRLPLGCS